VLARGLRETFLAPCVLLCDEPLHHILEHHRSDSLVMMVLMMERFWWLLLTASVSPAGKAPLADAWEA
jgi:hypothetical protein